MQCYRVSLVCRVDVSALSRIPLPTFLFLVSSSNWRKERKEGMERERTEGRKEEKINGKKKRKVNKKNWIKKFKEKKETKKSDEWWKPGRATSSRKITQTKTFPFPILLRAFSRLYIIYKFQPLQILFQLNHDYYISILIGFYLCFFIMYTKNTHFWLAKNGCVPCNTSAKL